MREVSFSTAKNYFAVEVEPLVRGDASPAYAPVGYSKCDKYAQGEPLNGS